MRSSPTYSITTSPRYLRHMSTALAAPARAGREGVAVSFCDFGEKPLLKDIEKLIGRTVLVVEDHPFPMVVLEAPKRDSRGRIVNEEDAEARGRRQGAAPPAGRSQQGRCGGAQAPGGPGPAGGASRAGQGRGEASPKTPPPQREERFTGGTGGPAASGSHSGTWPPWQANSSRCPDGDRLCHAPHRI